MAFDLTISELKLIAQEGASALADAAAKRGMTQQALRIAIERASRNAATPIIRGLAAQAYSQVAAATLVEAGAAATGVGTGAAAAVATGAGLALGVKVVIVVGIITGIAALGFLAHKEWKHWTRPKPPAVATANGQNPATPQPNAPAGAGTGNSAANQPNAKDASTPNTPAAPVLGAQPPKSVPNNGQNPSAKQSGAGGTVHQPPGGNPPGPQVEKFTLENTKGKKLSEALGILNTFDPIFKIVGDTPAPEDEDKLRVVAQDPPGGEWPRRHPVVLTVMLMPLSAKAPDPGAPPTAPVPNVVGMSVAEAQPIIVGAQFKPVIQL